MENQNKLCYTEGYSANTVYITYGQLPSGDLTHGELGDTQQQLAVATSTQPINEAPVIYKLTSSPAVTAVKTDPVNSSTSDCCFSEVVPEKSTSYETVFVQQTNTKAIDLLDYSRIQHMLCGKAQILFIAPDKLRLRCYLTKSKSVTKVFNCSSKGKDDGAAVEAIQNFIKSDKCQSWLKQALNKTCAKRGTPSRKRKKTVNIITQSSEYSVGNQVEGKQGGSLNFTKIRHLICGNPDISHVKLNNKLRLRCILSNGRQATKYFHCSKQGRNDRAALEAIQDFVNSEQCASWLKQCLEKPNAKKESESLKTEHIADLIVKPPEIIHTKVKRESKLSLRVYLKTGKSKNKFFPCSANGKGDKEALEKIRSFVESVGCRKWLLEIDRWEHLGQVSVGTEAKRYLDSLTFDINQEVLYDHSKTVVEYDEETPHVSVTRHPRWGKTNRIDQKFLLSQDFESSDNNDTTVVRWYIKCASKSAECRSDCGKLLDELKITNDLCSNCGYDLRSGKQCYNCYRSHSSQWYNQEDRVLCQTCYEYFRIKGVDRPQGSSNKSVPSKVHHIHLKCKWQLKLVLKTSNMGAWDIYSSTANKVYHSTNPVQVNKRPSLSTRDNWDRLRISTKASAKKIFDAEQGNQSLSVEASQSAYHPVKQIESRIKRADRQQFKFVTCEPDSTDHNSDWKKTESQEHDYERTAININTTDVRTYPPCARHLTGGSVQDLQADNTDGHHEECYDDLLEPEPMTKKKKLEEYFNPIVELPDDAFVCGICIEEGNSTSPFWCTSPRAYSLHVAAKHYKIACGECCRVGIKTYFPNFKQLQLHQQKHVRPVYQQEHLTPVPPACQPDHPHTTYQEFPQTVYSERELCPSSLWEPKVVHVIENRTDTLPN